MNPLSPIAFAGMNRLTSDIHQQGKIKAGTVVIQWETGQPVPGIKLNDTFNRKIVKSLKPHQGQKDSAGYFVPEGVQPKHDKVDMLTFTDGTTALVGEYKELSVVTPELNNLDTFIVGAKTADSLVYRLGCKQEKAYERVFYTEEEARPFMDLHLVASSGLDSF